MYYKSQIVFEVGDKVRLLEKVGTEDEYGVVTLVGPNNFYRVETKNFYDIPDKKWGYLGFVEYMEFVIK